MNVFWGFDYFYCSDAGDPEKSILLLHYSSDLYPLNCSQITLKRPVAHKVFKNNKLYLINANRGVK